METPPASRSDRSQYLLTNLPYPYHRSVRVPHVRTSVRGPKTTFFNCFQPRAQGSRWASPGFPVEFVGFAQLHAAFPNKVEQAACGLLREHPLQIQSIGMVCGFQITRVSRFAVGRGPLPAACIRSAFPWLKPRPRRFWTDRVPSACHFARV